MSGAIVQLDNLYDTHVYYAADLSGQRTIVCDELVNFNSLRFLMQRNPLP
jgi:hypothetical protein